MQRMKRIYIAWSHFFAENTRTRGGTNTMRPSCLQGLAGWPKLHFEVWSLDEGGRTDVCGYG